MTPTANEAGFVKAMAKVTPLYGEAKMRDTVVDMGWNICKIIETLDRDSALSVAHTNPRKAEAYVSAAETYICPQ